MLQPNRNALLVDNPVVVAAAAAAVLTIVFKMVRLRYPRELLVVVIILDIALVNILLLVLVIACYNKMVPLQFLYAFHSSVAMVDDNGSSSYARHNFFTI